MSHTGQGPLLNVYTWWKIDLNLCFSSLSTHIICFLPLTFLAFSKVSTDFIITKFNFFFFSLLTSLQYFILKINPPFVKFSFLFALVVFHHLGYPPTFWSIFLWALFHLQLSKYTPKFFISSSLSKCSFFENLIISHLHTDELQLLIFKCFLDSFRYCSSSCPELNLLLLSFSSLSPIIYIPFLEE